MWRPRVLMRWWNMLHTMKMLYTMKTAVVMGRVLGLGGASSRRRLAVGPSSWNVQ